MNLYLSTKVRTTGLVIVVFLSALSILNAQSDISYSFIAAGHAYGSHEGENIGLHPALLRSLHSGFESSVEFLVFTGDIVNFSTAESWQQVESELDSIGKPFYYVMGNHDDNAAGEAVFWEKFGGTYYSFYSRGDLFIVLNSIEADRAISEKQLIFLQEQIDLAGDSTGNIFIFFHEIIWNSHEKYQGVRSNSRSRYDQVVEHSNYWEEVHPILMNKPDKRFFLIAGDVGGNPDAISVFYDRWDHITFLASGMGEVADENYLLVHVYDNDSTDFEIIPLNAELSLPGIEYYSVPPVPGPISGPDFVFQGSKALVYSVPVVFNAEAYQWVLPIGATGSSSTDRIEVDFDERFKNGELSVRALRDGFGGSAATSMLVQADYTSLESFKAENSPPPFKVHEGIDKISIECFELNGDEISFRIMDTGGRVLFSKQVPAQNCYHEFQISSNDLPRGVLFITAWTKNRRFTEKIMVR